MESQLNRSLVNIQEFVQTTTKIHFNASKSIVSLFTTNRHLYNYSSELFLMREHLNYSKYPTYLGFTLDSEVNCGKHIEKIADKARKRLKILKYLSGRDWGSDASTLRITYTTLVLPVLEYGYQIFHVASPTNLKKLERAQLSAARIITDLRYSCPTDIVLYEADIRSLTMRFEVKSYSGALDHALNFYKDSIWILTDSRSSIQYLKNKPKIMDSTGLDILFKLVRLGQRKKTANLSLYPHPPSTNQRAVSQLSSRLKFPATSRQEDHVKPRLPDLLATTNRLHATPQTVKFHQTPSPSSKVFMIWD
ncbi:putative RNA-directed DNA polymerase from transposon BS [Trichonephila clavipes]|nr:putative RNA-directed DNA polymerase from transposon BS [Trichonephila clavipes]